jgi:hypothetical protein
MLVTANEIEAARTPNGGWTKATLAQWGVPWPPSKGWKQRLLAQVDTHAERRDVEQARPARVGSAVLEEDAHNTEVSVRNTGDVE